MAEERDHAGCVSAWLRTAAHEAPSERLTELFEQALRALWQRAHVTLGGITLTAIVDRVLYSAAEQYPVLSSLSVEPTGLQFQEFRERATRESRDQLIEAIRFGLIEFLTVLGDLTGDILTPALHAQLLTVAPKKAPS
jgi:hypothetical protein